MTWALTLDGDAVNLAHVVSIERKLAGFNIDAQDPPEPHTVPRVPVFEISARTADDRLLVLGLCAGEGSSRGEISRLAGICAAGTTRSYITVPTDSGLFTRWLQRAPAF